MLVDAYRMLLDFPRLYEDEKKDTNASEYVFPFTVHRKTLLCMGNGICMSIVETVIPDWNVGNVHIFLNKYLFLFQSILRTVICIACGVGVIRVLYKGPDEVKISALIACFLFLSNTMPST